MQYEGTENMLTATAAKIAFNVVEISSRIPGKTAKKKKNILLFGKL